MSKKNNKGSKKKNNRKNYKIESLEPRLLMDASVSDWSDELNALNVGVYTIEHNRCLHLRHEKKYIWRRTVLAWGSLCPWNF